MVITLVRHGKPDYNGKRRLRRDELAEELDKYNAAGLRKDSLPAAAVKEAVGSVSLLISSDLPRAIHSAQRLETNHAIVIEKLFREAPPPARLPVPNWLQLSPTIWLILARALWFCGWAGDVESLRDAHRRAQAAARFLIERTASVGSVMLIGHQMFNLLIARELRTRGWRGPLMPHHAYWSCTQYISR